MTTKKQTKDERIAELKRKLSEAQAGMVHVYHFAEHHLEKMNTQRLAASGVVLTLTTLGGATTTGPVLIRGGLSAETIAAIKADFARSYQDAIAFKPKGAQ